MGFGTEIHIRYQVRISNFVTPRPKTKQTGFNLSCRRYILAYGYLTRTYLFIVLFSVVFLTGVWSC
jgi:hypothetical protein